MGLTPGIRNLVWHREVVVKHSILARVGLWCVLVIASEAMLAGATED